MSQVRTEAVLSWHGLLTQKGLFPRASEYHPSERQPGDGAEGQLRSAIGQTFVSLVESDRSLPVKPLPFSVPLQTARRTLQRNRRRLGFPAKRFVWQPRRAINWIYWVALRLSTVRLSRFLKQLYLRSEGRLTETALRVAPSCSYWSEAK